MSKTVQVPKTPPIDVVDVSGMKAIGVRPNLSTYMRQLWQLRHFIHEQARGKAFRNSRGTILGRLWILIEPFLNSAIYIVLFGMILHLDRGIPNFVGYMFVGSIIFMFCRSTLGTSGEIMQQSTPLLQSFTFPRATIVVAHIEMLTLNALSQYTVMLIGVLFVGDGARPSIHWFAFPLIVVLQIIFNLGLAFFVSALTSRIPDLKFIWRLVAIFWFYGSGIFFSVSRFVTHPVVASLMEANPGYVLLTISRDLILYNQMPPLSMWFYFIVWSIGLLIVGGFLFWRNEENYGAKNDR